MADVPSLAAARDEGAWERLRARALRWHLPGLALAAATTAWLMRRFLFSGALPAGTDFLGFVTRARENADWERVASLWAPSAWGAVRQFTADNLLGVLTLATGSPVWTVKLLAAATLFGAGAFAYALSWSWYRSRVAATVAGLVYMTSQASISRWASGQLNVEIAFATAPLLLLLWIRCVERFSVARAAAFAFAAGGVMLVRLDMVLYVVPFLALHAVVHVALDAQPRRAVGALARTVGVVVPASLALGAYQLVPILSGVRASWLSTGGLFDADEFLDRSLDAHASLLALGREIGYLGFTGQQTWYSHPWLPLWAYFAAASALPLAAFAALRWHRDRRTIFLAASAVVGAFLGKGLRPPLDEPYRWAAENVPVFANLREPNRWLIPVTLAYAVLAGLAFVRAWEAARARRPAAYAAAGAAALLVALPTAPTLASGLRAWRPSAAQLALLEPVERDRDEFRVATVPFDQTVRFVEQRGYRGFEHDLGAESAAFTGHPALGDGGWHQKASDTVAFLARLLDRRDPAFVDLLGTLGVKYVVSFGYPATAPHLRTGLSSAARRNPAAGSGVQQRALASLPGLELVLRNEAGTLYRVRRWSRELTARPNLAVVLGGRSGLAALPAVVGDLRPWAAVTADDAIEQGGLARLVELVGRGDLVLVANERPRDVALLATPPLARLASLSSDEGLDRLTQLLPSDESARTGSLADQTVPPADRGATSASARFAAPARGPAELWLRLDTSPRAAAVRVLLDGRRVRTLVPVSPRGGGFRWFRAFARTLSPGSEHVVELRVEPSVYGEEVDLDEARVVAAPARARAERALAAALAARRDAVAYALDVEDAGKWTAGEPARPEPVARDPDAFWRPLEARVRLAPVPGRGGAPAVAVAYEPGRTVYTFVRHRFARPLDWSGRSHLFLDVRGTASGRTFTFVVEFDRRSRRTARYSFVDDRLGWRTLAFGTQRPDSGRPRWLTVRGVRLAVDRLDAAGELQVGALALSRLEPVLSFRFPIVPASRPRPLALDRRTLTRVAAGSGAILVRAPLETDRGRLVVAPADGVAAHTLRRVSFARTGATEYRWAAGAGPPATLVLAQAYQQGWSAGSRTVYAATSVYALINGFPLGRASSSGVVRFDGDAAARRGLGLSALGAVALLGLAGVSRRRAALGERTA